MSRLQPSSIHTDGNPILTCGVILLGWPILVIALAGVISMLDRFLGTQCLPVNQVTIETCHRLGLLLGKIVYALIPAFLR